MINFRWCGVDALTISCSCAQILQVLHPVEESTDTLAFATEPVMASLANILAFHVSNTCTSIFRVEPI